MLLILYFGFYVCLNHNLAKINTEKIQTHYQIQKIQANKSFRLPESTSCAGGRNTILNPLLSLRAVATLRRSNLLTTESGIAKMISGNLKNKYKTTAVIVWHFYIITRLPRQYSLMVLPRVLYTLATVWL